MRRRRFIGVIICLLGAAGLFLWLNWPSEPAYQGKTLTQWMDTIAPRYGSYGFGTPPSRIPEQQWEEAIEHMGSQSLPLLVKWLDDEPALDLNTVFQVRQKLPRPIQNSRVMSWVQRKTAEREMKLRFRAQAAERALILLKQEAVPVIPELGRIFRSSKTRAGGHGAYQAGNVLSALGKKALPEVLKCWSDPRFSNYLAFAQVIGRMRGLGEAGGEAVPMLVTLLQHPDPNVKRASVEALGNLALRPEVAIPDIARMLTNALADETKSIGVLQASDVILWRKCAEALGRFGVAASNAVPVLCVTLKSTDGITTEEAARALGRIGTAPNLAVPALIDYLRHGNGGQRKYAIEGLKGYGAAAREAVPLIIEALNDLDHDTRTTAQEALQIIVPK